MRLTLSTLPQLAVLVKILCLLMVVMCGAVPAMVRSVSLYSTCSSGNVTVMGHKISAVERDDYNAPYQKLTTQSEDFSGKLYIYAEESKQYICFNKYWRLVPRKTKKPRCQFLEGYNGPYLTYRSAQNESRFVGFNKFGKPMSNQQRRPECFNFIKYNPHVNIDYHNNMLRAQEGTSGADKKNSSSQVDSTRENVHTSNRYRHDKHRKMRKNKKVMAPQRRHKSRLFVEANKY
ncbi:unnamed protein product [Xylocopa violacea]|uniref:Uncharacterized protein n=1 Tax=Xylocopa violacea TaxID=135666 RepID=A0ABP1NX78_XYLVO